MVPGKDAAGDSLKKVRKKLTELEGNQIESLATVTLSSCEEALQQGRQFDFIGYTHTDRGPIKTTCLTDTGASAMGFVDLGFAKIHKIPLLKLTKPVILRLANNKRAPNITHTALIKFSLGGHVDEVCCLVTTLGKFDIALGMPWLERHDPDISPGSRKMTFSSDYCISKCLEGHRPVTVYGCGSKDAKQRVKRTSADIAEISAYAFTRMAERPNNEVIAMWPDDFERLSKDEGNESCKLTTDIAAISPDDYEKFFAKLRKKPMSEEQLKQRVPKHYHKWLKVWSPTEANKVPPNRSVDHSIDLIAGSKPPAKRAYGMSREQALVVKEYIDEMLGKGFIRPSTSPYAAPVLIVKKPDGGIRICVDYRALNALTIRNRNAPPLIKDTLARLCAAKIYSKFDIIAAFNEIRIKKGHEEKTAFLTRYGLYEYVVMPFGLCNAPATFQAFINETLREYLDVFCTAYLDDILIYSNSMAEHIRHVQQVLDKLLKAGLFLDINKCDFHVKEVRYLGLIITTEGLKMDPRKVDTIMNWKTPRCVKDVQSFLGFANFYRRFIKGYSKIAAPLINLTKTKSPKAGGSKMDMVFPLAPKGPEEKAFVTLKEAFIKAPILAHFNPDRETWVETDASDYVAAGVLSQKDDNDILRPVAFMSHKMSPQECNYEIYDKELLAIIRAFEEWHPELAGTPVGDPVKVLTDHKNLEHFMTTKQLNRRQARWAEFLSEFNFKIEYRPGKQGTKPDSLTRRPGDLPDDDSDPRRLFQNQTILKKGHLSTGVRRAAGLAALLLDEYEMGIQAICSMAYDLSEQGVSDGEESIEELPLDALGDPSVEESMEESADGDLIEGSIAEGPVDESIEDSTGPLSANEVMDYVRRMYPMDDTVQRIMASKTAGDRKIPLDLIKQGLRIELGDCEIHDTMLYVNKRLYVPDVDDTRTRVLQTMHDTPPTGHAGRTSTYLRASKYYYWPKMTESVSRYVKSCYTCKRAKSSRSGKHGLLKPLPIPEKYWTDISVDFVTPLPICKQFGRSFEHIMVVVDRLSKKRRFVALDSLDVEAVVQAFVEWVWREEGYPSTIVSDRGTQFIAHFWSRLCKRLGTKPKLSTAFHPETDGQTENANAALKQYLRAFVNYNQSDWVSLLPIAEFEANADENASGLSPFLATKGYVPRSGAEPPTPWDSNATQRAKNEIKAADTFVAKIEKLRIYLREQLRWIQALQSEQANRRRHPAPEFRVGDMVMLDARNIKTTRPNKSLDHKNLGPFEIVRVINNSAYELKLPPAMEGIFPVFHPWLLHLDNSEPLQGQRIPPPPPVMIDQEGEEHWGVQEILDSRIDKRRNDPLTGKRGCLMYKIRYTGYDEDRPDWEPYQNTAGCPALVADYHHLYPDKPGPHQSFRTPQDWEPLLAMMLQSSHM